MNILVTGASGFVGNAVINEFHKQGYNVIATARNSKKINLNFDIEIRHFDFEKEPNYDELLKDIDVVCHAASWATMWGHKSQEEKKYYLPTKRLINESKMKGVKRFILTSTIAANERSKNLLKDNLTGKKYGVWPHLDFLIDLENHLSTIANDHFQTISLRLGHFIGAGNTLGLIPVFLPRLKTFIVPWINEGKSIVPLIGPNDIALAFVLSAIKKLESNNLKLNIASKNSPTMRELLTYISKHHNYPKPIFSVPYWVAYSFAFICEIFANLTGTTPFLSRALVHLGENWQTDNKLIQDLLDYKSVDDWKMVLENHIQFLEQKGLKFSLQNN